MIDIKTISFLQSPLLKYATFDPNELWPPWSNLASEAKLKISNGHSLENMIDIKTNSFLQSPWSNTQLLTKINFDLRGQIWPLRPNWKFQILIAQKLWASSISHSVWKSLTPLLWLSFSIHSIYLSLQLFPFPFH